MAALVKLGIPFVPSTPSKAGLARSRRLGPTLVAAVIALLLVTIVFRAAGPGEPSYQGRSLSSWLTEYDKFNDVAYAHASPPQPWPHDAVRHMGTNAIPWLLKSLTQRDSRFKMAVMRLVKLQSVFKLHITPARVRQERVAAAFETLGPMAEPAIPALIELLADPDARRGALSSLSNIGQACVPPVVRALTNRDPAIKSGLVWVLYDRYPFATGEPAKIDRDQANVSAPILLEILTTAATAGTNWNFVAAAALVVNWIIPERVPKDVLPILISGLTDPQLPVRERAAFALRHIHKDPGLTVPALTMALDDPAEPVRTWASIGLRYFKTDAAVAVPKLRLLLPAATGGARNAIATALADIDPCAAEEAGAYEALGVSPPP